MVTYKANNLSYDGEYINMEDTGNGRNMLRFIDWRIYDIESNANCQFCWGSERNPSWSKQQV